MVRRARPQYKKELLQFHDCRVVEHKKLPRPQLRTAKKEPGISNVSETKILLGYNKEERLNIQEKTMGLDI